MGKRSNARAKARREERRALEAAVRAERKRRVEVLARAMCKLAGHDPEELCPYPTPGGYFLARMAWPRWMTYRDAARAALQAQGWPGMERKGDEQESA